MNRRMVLLALAFGIALDSWAFHGRYSAAVVSGAINVKQQIVGQHWSSPLLS